MILIHQFHICGVVTFFVSRPLKEYYEVRLMEKTEMNCQPNNETIMVASKKGTLACYFSLIAPSPHIDQNRGYGSQLFDHKITFTLNYSTRSSFLTPSDNSSHFKESLQVPEKKRLKSEVRSQALPYQICPIVIATRTRASKKLHITTRELVFSLMAR